MAQTVSFFEDSSTTFVRRVTIDDANTVCTLVNDLLEEILDSSLEEPQSKPEIS
jgi:hypothetical protein